MKQKLILLVCILSLVFITLISCNSNDNNEKPDVENPNGNSGNVDGSGDGQESDGGNGSSTPEKPDDNKKPDNGDKVDPEDPEEGEGNGSQDKPEDGGDSKPTVPDDPTVEPEKPEEPEKPITPPDPGESTGPINGCEHTYSTTWSANPTHHWLPATCEHGEARANYATHYDQDEDGFCDACAYEVGHTHSYSKNWTSDLTHHWRKAICTHKNNIIGFELHYDNTSNGECDVCSSHVHKVLESGKCYFCGEQVRPVNTSNLVSVIAAISEGYSKINGGSIQYSFTGNSSGGTHARLQKTIDYLLGKDSAYFMIMSSADVNSADKDGNSYDAKNSDIVEKWQQRLPDGSYFGVYRESYDGTVGSITIDGSVNSSTLRGYCYNVSTLANAYGAEGILSELYRLSQESYSDSFKLTHSNGSRYYSFSFNTLLVNSMNTTVGMVYNANYFKTSVEFEHDANYALVYLNITCEVYTSDPGADLNNNILEDEIDLDYDERTGTFELRKTARADVYSYTVEQTVGEKTYETPYPKSDFIPTSYEVYSNEECTLVSPDTVTVNKGEFLKLFLKEPGAGGRKFTSDEGLVFSFKNLDELTPNAGLNPLPFSPFSSRIGFFAAAAGEYVITIEYGGIVRTFNLTVIEI